MLWVEITMIYNDGRFLRHISHQDDKKLIIIFWTENYLVEIF